MSSFLNKQLLTHRRQIISVAPALSSSMNTVMLSPPSTNTLLSITSKSHCYHTSTPLQRPGWKPPRNPKISITLEQLRMAARGTGRRVPICHDEQEKVMNALEAAKYEVCVCLCAYMLCAPMICLLLLLIYMYCRFILHVLMYYLSNVLSPFFFVNQSIESCYL